MFCHISDLVSLNPVEEIICIVFTCFRGVYIFI